MEGVFFFAKENTMNQFKIKLLDRGIPEYVDADRMRVTDAGLVIFETRLSDGPQGGKHWDIVYVFNKTSWEYVKKV
jgi:hypothetical protein